MHAAVDNLGEVDEVADVALEVLGVDNYYNIEAAVDN